jgi:putative transposase
MIDRTHKLSIARQAEALGISRGAVYYVPRAVSDFDLFDVARPDAIESFSILQ